MREYGFSLTRILPNKDKIYDFILIRENMGQLKPVLSHILCSSVFHLWYTQTSKSILKPLDGQCREKINLLNTERKCKTPYTEKFNTHMPSGWCLHDTFACWLMDMRLTY